LTRLQTKRTRRNALSKRKRWLSHRGIENQGAALRGIRSRNRAWSAKMLESHMKDPVKFPRLEAIKPVEKRRGFFARLFRRGIA